MSAGIIAAHYVVTPGPVAGYANTVLADAPLAYYRLGDPASPMMDASGNGRNGSYSITGTTSLSQPGLLVGDSDTCLSLNISSGNEFASVPNATWMNPSTITLEALVKPSSMAASVKSILDRDSPTAAQRQFQFRISASAKFEFIFWTADGTLRVATGTASLAANAVYHLAATYDGTTARLYVNGMPDGSLAASGTLRASSATLSIGVNRNIASGSQSYTGWVDEVAYYGSALSASRIAAHYNAAIGA